MFSRTNSFAPLSAVNSIANARPCLLSAPCQLGVANSIFKSRLSFTFPFSAPENQKFLPCSARSKKSNPQHTPEPDVSEKDKEGGRESPMTIPRKPRRGRRSEAAAVEDFIRNSLDKTLLSIQQQNPELLENDGNLIKERIDDSEDDCSDKDDNDGGRKGKKMTVEEEDPDWPLDADVGWGIRASDYFEQHSIKNVVGDDGVEIDWEGELDDSWVQEINCLEWENFAFHPSPLVVLIFERYNRSSDNWRALKELEKAIKVYWDAKDRLPPRAVKIDIKIERDLAYALKAKECPQILFLGKNRILYREKEIRTADELVQMMAYFYYNAKKPSWIDDSAWKRSW